MFTTLIDDRHTLDKNYQHATPAAKTKQQNASADKQQKK